MSYVALITGASSGIGEATARRLAALGAEHDLRLVLVARRAERLQELADQLDCAVTVIAADLTDPAAAQRLAQTVEREHGELHLLINNAGARWSATFAEGGWENLARHLQVNLEAPARLVEALLPLLTRTAAGVAPRTQAPTRQQRRTLDLADPRAPVAIVNVASTSARVARRGTGGYAASKFALAGWSDSLALELAALGVHVGLVLPGFVATEGFPQAELLASARTRWLVADPSLVAQAILQAGPGGRPERYAPRYYWLFGALRMIAPRLLSRAMNRGTFTTATRSR